MNNIEKIANKAHKDAVKFWSGVPWYLTNQEIEQVINRPYNTIAKYRKIYAKHTLGVRKSWKPKVLKLINGESNYLVAKNFVEQASARTAGYALGKQLKQSRKPSLIYLKLKD